MNLADQIEGITRDATDRVAAASRAFSLAQAELTERASTERRDASAAARLRAELLDDADAADAATPRIMLPADVAEASPHRHPDTP
ncbi:hypothetical protein ACWDTD_05985 [Gordonia sp. NPDC003425]